MPEARGIRISTISGESCTGDRQGGSMFGDPQAGGHKGPHPAPHNSRPYGMMITYAKNLAVVHADLSLSAFYAIQ